MARAKKTVLQKRLKFVGGALLALVGLILLLLWFAGRFVTAERLVLEVEDSLNCRLAIEDVEVRALRWPSTVVLRGVRIGERDEWVGSALEDRPPLGESVVEIEEVRLAVSLAGLLFGEIDVKELAFVRPRVQVTVFEEGGNDLMELFEPAPDRAERRKRRGKRPGGALNVEEVGLLARLNGVRMEEGEAMILIEKTGMLVKVEEASAVLNEIEVDPAALEKTNRAAVQLSGKVTLGWSDEGKEPSGYLELEGSASARLFDPVSADLDPDAVGTLSLSENSYLSARVPPINLTWSILGRLANWGMTIGGLPERATFGRGQTVGVRYYQERFEAMESLALLVGDWELAVLEGAWVDMADEQHDIFGELVASEGVSSRLYAGLQKSLAKVPKLIRPEVVAEVEGLWFQDERLFVRGRSYGPLSDPEVDVQNKFPDVKEIAKKALERYGKENLEGLSGWILERLTGDDDEEEDE